MYNTIILNTNHFITYTTPRTQQTTLLKKNFVKSVLNI